MLGVCGSFRVKGLGEVSSPCDPEKYISTRGLSCLLWPHHFPQGSMCPNSIYFGPKIPGSRVYIKAIRPDYILVGYMDPYKP